MEPVHDRVAAAASDQPAVDRERDDRRDQERDGQAGPEEAVQHAGIAPGMSGTIAVSTISIVVRQWTVASKAAPVEGGRRVVHGSHVWDRIERVKRPRDIRPDGR